MEQVKLLEPRKVYLMTGIDDVANISSDEFKKQYESLLMLLREQNPSTELIVFNMLPVNDVDYTTSCNNEQIMRCNKEIFLLCVKYGFVILICSLFMSEVASCPGR